MDCFDNFDPLSGNVPGFPFVELWRVASDARIYLAGLSVNDIRGIELTLDTILYETKLELAEYCLDDYASEVIASGSWELRYLPANTAPTQESVKRLLENWPDGVDQPDYLTEDDFSDVEALRTVISSGQIGELDSEHAYPVRCVAVLALMKVANCLDTMKCPEEDLGICEDGPIAARLIPAANYAIEAVQAIGYADELAAIAESEAEAAHELAETIQQKQQRFSKERARAAAAARHEHLKPAIAYVRAEWQKNCGSYKFNKTDFARTYVELVRNGYRNKRGDPLQVTIKTITDVWLAPSASKPTGEPADR